MTEEWSAHGEDADPADVDWIMHDETVNQYDPFAEASTNYVTVDDDAETTTHGAFTLYSDMANTKEVLVKSDNVYGTGRKIDRLIFDVAHNTSSIDHTASVDAEPGEQPKAEGYGIEATLTVRPILDDFSAASIGYASAAALSFGTAATVTLFSIMAQLGVDTNGQSKTAHATVTGVAGSSNITGTFGFRRDTLETGSAIDVWNSAHATIYGWKLSLGVGGADTAEAEFSGALDNAATICYAIRP